MNRSAILWLSLRPAFAERFLRGTKTVELRRTRPRVSLGDHALLYAAAPVNALVATAVARPAVALGSRWRGCDTG
jgi:predicted transcriptional regulator